MSFKIAIFRKNFQGLQDFILILLIQFDMMGVIHLSYIDSIFKKQISIKLRLEFVQAFTYYSTFFLF